MIQFNISIVLDTIYNNTTVFDIALLTKRKNLDGRADKLWVRNLLRVPTWSNLVSKGQNLHPLYYYYIKIVFYQIDW